MKLFNPSITLCQSYIVYDFDNMSEPTLENLNLINNILSVWENKGYFTNKNTFLCLFSMEKNELKDILKESKEIFPVKKGVFFRESFASKNLEDETMTFDEAIKQLIHYMDVYGLNNNSDIFFKLGLNSNRNIDVNIEQMKFDKKINKHLKIIDIISFKEFDNKINNILFQPIVFGTEQIDFLSNIYKEYRLKFVQILKNETFFIKENLFSVLKFLDNSIIKELDIFKNTNDILRYILFLNDINDYDFGQSNISNTNFKRKLHSFDVIDINLTTSQKKMVMFFLNNLSLSMSDMLNEMKPKYSIWRYISYMIRPKSNKFNKFPIAQTVFFTLINQKFKTSNTFKELAKSEKQIRAYIILLKDNIGELLRNLDFIIRNSSNTDIDFLIKHLECYQKNLNPKLVLQLKKYLNGRSLEAQSERIINVRGKIIKSDKLLPQLDKNKVEKVTNFFQEYMKSHLCGQKLF